MVAMGKSRASTLLKFFKSEELRVMIDAAHTLKSIPQPDLEELVKEFETEFTVGAGLMDSADAMDKILSEALSDEEMYALTGMSAEPVELEPEQSVWDLLPKVDIDELNNFFAGESPQLCAVVLSRLNSRTAASIVERLEPDLRKATVARLLSSKPVPENVIKTVEILERRLEHIKTPMSLSIIGCVVNGPGEALMTDVGFTGGGAGSGMVYLAGKQSHKLSNEQMIDHIVEQVEKKAAEIEAAGGVAPAAE